MINEKDPSLENEQELYEVELNSESEQDYSEQDSSEVIDIEKAEQELEQNDNFNDAYASTSQFDDIDETSEENKQALFEIKLLQKRRTLKWAASLILFILVFILISVGSLILIKNKFIKPSVITKITDYVRSSNENDISVLDDEIIYKPNKIVNGVSLDDLKKLIHAKDENQTKFRFQFYKKDKDGNKKEISKISEEEILNPDNKFYMYISFDGDKNNVFSIYTSQYREVPFKIDLTKQLFLYNEQNNLIYKASKTELYQKILDYMKNYSLNTMEAFRKIIDASIKDVYLPDNSVNPKYNKLFLQKARNEYISEKDLENIFQTNSSINKLYIDDFASENDTIFRFHNEFNKKVYEMKNKSGNNFSLDELARIRERITLPNQSYFLKDESGNDYITNSGNKLKIDGSNKYEIEDFLTDLNDKDSKYDFTKPCYHPNGNIKTETYNGKRYRIIDVYSKIKVKKANLLFRTLENEIIFNYQLDCGLISKMPVDLEDEKFNQNDKYYKRADKYFYGWKVVNDNSEITFEKIKKGEFYNLKEDIILEPIIKNKIRTTVNLPHEDYKPSRKHDKNYEYLTLTLKEDDNLYEHLMKKLEEIRKTLPYFDLSNEFLGMYSDINYLSQIDNKTYAKDIETDSIVYFRYKITYVKIEFPNFFKNLYFEILRSAKLDLPILETDVVNGDILYETYFEKLTNLNKNNDLVEILRKYFISQNKYSYNKTGSKILLKVHKNFVANMNVMAYDINGRNFFAETSCEREYEIIPELKEALNYNDKLQTSKDENISKLNYLSFPYFAYKGEVYKILSISTDYLFRKNLEFDDKISKLDYIKNNNKFYFPIYLSVEKTNIDVSYRYLKDGKTLWEKTIKSYYSPFNYKDLKLNDRLYEFGYKLLKNPENLFPSDYEVNPEHYIKNSTYHVNYAVGDLNTNKLLEYVYFSLKFSKQIYDEIKENKITRKEDFTGAFPYAYKNNYQDMVYFESGKNIFDDYEGVKNLFLSAFYMFTKHKFEDYFDIKKYTISGFIYYKNGNSVNNLEFLNGPISPKDKYKILDGMLIEFNIKKI